MFHAVNSSHLVLFSGKIGGASEILRPFSSGQAACSLFAFTGKTLRRLPAGGFQFFPRFFKVPQEARR